MPEPPEPHGVCYEAVLVETGGATTEDIRTRVPYGQTARESRCGSGGSGGSGAVGSNHSGVDSSGGDSCVGGSDVGDGSGTVDSGSGEMQRGGSGSGYGDRMRSGRSEPSEDAGNHSKRANGTAIGFIAISAYSTDGSPEASLSRIEGRVGPSLDNGRQFSASHPITRGGGGDEGGSRTLTAAQVDRLCVLPGHRGIGVKARCSTISSVPKP